MRRCLDNGDGGSGAARTTSKSERWRPGSGGGPGFSAEIIGVGVVARKSRSTMLSQHLGELSDDKARGAPLTSIEVLSHTASSGDSDR